MHFPEKDKIFSRLHTILPTNAKVVVAFSGGPDSSFLFALLKEFYKSQSRNQQNIILAHFHHGQRKESDKELAHLFKQHEQYDIYYNPKKPKK